MVKSKKNNLIYICLGVVIVICIFIYVTYQKPIELFESSAEIIGNPQLLRDGSNISSNPKFEEKKVVLDYNNGKEGWTPAPGHYINIKLNSTKVLKGVGIKGTGNFNIRVLIKNDNDSVGKWHNAHDVSKAVGTSDSLVFSGGNSALKTYQLVANNSQHILCDELEVKAVNIESTSANNVQMEVYAIEPDAYTGSIHTEPLADVSNGFDENHQALQKTDGFIKWNAEGGNNKPHFKVEFSKNDEGISNKMIYSLRIKANGNDKVSSFSLRYRRDGSKSTQHIDNILGNMGQSETVIHYFKYPVMASTIGIYPASGSSGSSLGCQIAFYGKIIKTKEDEEMLIGEQDTYHQIVSNQGKKQTCPPVSQLINKQAEIHQLCDAMEQADEIEFEKKKIDTDKMYLVRLEQQKKEIKRLEDKIKEMHDANKKFDDIDDRNKLAMFKYQEDMDKKLKELVQKRLEKQTALNFNLQVKDPEDQANSANSGNTVETFVSSYKFQKGGVSQRLPPEHFYEEFVGNPFFR